MSTQVPEVLVRAPRVTLDEILDRVARGEARRESLLTDQAFNATFRLVRVASTTRPAELFEEVVTRVYKKRPDRVRSVMLRHRSRDPKGNRAEVDIHFRPSMGEDIVNFAFQPEARRQFRYRIAGRTFVGDHVVYTLAFEPRSRLDPSQPSGLVWVDTNEFVILRQEVRFDRSPVPIFLKDVRRMVIERQRVDGFWVLKRVLLRAEMTIPIPKFGRAFDVTLLFDQYAINSGLADSLFTGASR